ncbi:alpha/beta fold hydrolase [Schaalia sp. 19OD2882]|uniref:alpha/beta fold hydrolase n=1 Tax=Schaalia sp. 19OD2882 TaxID=2794089 RepID=UPI001C1EC323|nr:alpha/beta fold hydrolase [Schaalia sp. 19OD2882]QWW19556.1 alpha/beta fold hydrolase [Schaalia sp. 19OD2882]
MGTVTYRQHSCTVHEHRFDVPLDHMRAVGADNPTIEVFAREVVRDGGEDLPHVVHLQGGPGHEAPRNGDFHDGFVGHLLKDHRVVLLDQRGTGQSTRLDVRSLLEGGDFTGTGGTVDAQRLADHLALFRQDQIIRDAEVVREALTGGKPWSTIGQSYGGFLTLAYLSAFPEALTKCLVTGGLAGMVHVDEIYRRTYAATAARNETYFRRHRADRRTIREIAAHLRDTEELLPTGERLTPARFRLVGMSLGGSLRTDLLHYLFEGPWVTVGGRRRLSADFLAQVGTQLAWTPMYAVLHEAIYAGATPDLAGTATNWSAERLSREVPGFHPDADPLDEAEPWYLSGEHMTRAAIAEDPATRPFLEAVDVMAARTDWPAVYLPEVLKDTEVPVAAAVYHDDMFVPRDLSLATADLVGARTWITNEFQHDGLRASGGTVVDRLVDLLAD